MVTIHGRIGRQHFESRLSNGRHTVVSDEPASAGGTDLGFSPSDLLASSLVACTCATLRMYADQKGWPLEAVDVTVTFGRSEDKSSSRFHCTLRLEGDLTAEQRDRLLTIAQRCNVHRILTSPIHIETELG